MIFNEKSGYCFHWLNCGFHSFWSISVQEKVLKSLSTSRTIYLYLNWIANGGQSNFTENWIWKELLFTWKAHDSFCSLNCCVVLSKPQNLDVFKKFFFINTEFHFNVFIKMENKTLCLSISFCVKIVLRTKSLTLGGLNSKYRA